MSRNLLQFIFILLIIINLTVSSSKSKSLLRTLNPNPLLNETTKDASDLKLHFKLKQTLYTDSLIDNYYYTIIYLGDTKSKHLYLLDSTSEIISSQCRPNVTALKCNSKVCNILPATTCKDKDDKNICSFSTKFNNNNSNNNNITTSIDSLNGFYVQDIAYLEEDTHILSPLQKLKYRSFAFPIACTTEKFGKYNSNNIKYDGILGINNSPKSFIGLLNKLKIINKNIFSICFGYRGGYMSLGEIDHMYHIDKDIKYMPLIDNKENLYKIKIKDISLDNSTVINYEGEAVIDTTSTLTYFPEKIYNEIFSRFNTYCENNKCGKFETIENKGYCASFEDRETLINTIFKKWPNIIFNFDIEQNNDNKDLNNTNNTNYIWKSMYYYIFHASEEPKKACLGFASHKLNHIIIGTKFFHGYDIIFNREEKKLGYVKADCSRGNMIWRRGMNHQSHFYNDNEMENRDKNGIIRKFMLRFNNSEDGIDFIKGRNMELNFSSDFKFVNFILLLISIIIVVIVAIIVISFLLFNKKAGLRYEEPDVAIESEPAKNEDYNNNYNNDDD